MEAYLTPYSIKFTFFNSNESNKMQGFDDNSFDIYFMSKT